MRKISNESDVPYLSDGIRYYEARDNALYEINQNEVLLREAYARAKAGESKLYFTWHGQFKTDTFEVDDLLPLGLAYGFEEANHMHDVEWRICDENERGAYFSVDLEFKCGCTFDGVDRDKRLQLTLKSLKGWEISKHSNGRNGKYSVRVLKSSMK